MKANRLVSPVSRVLTPAQRRSREEDCSAARTPMTGDGCGFGSELIFELEGAPDPE